MEGGSYEEEYANRRPSFEKDGRAIHHRRDGCRVEHEHLDGLQPSARRPLAATDNHHQPRSQKVLYEGRGPAAKTTVGKLNKRSPRGCRRLGLERNNTVSTSILARTGQEYQDYDPGFVQEEDHPSIVGILPLLSPLFLLSHLFLHLFLRPLFLPQSLLP